MSEWQPMETAPRDGTAVLAWIPKRKSAVVVRRMEWDDWLWHFDEGGEGYTDESLSHWMPIPPPPQSG